MAMVNMEEELVDVKVPRRDLGSVYRLLGELESSRTTQPSDEAITGWTPELIRRAVQESDIPMRSVLTCLAERADEEVPAKDLEAAIEKATGEAATKFTLAGTLGAFGRRVASRYGLRDSRGRAMVPWLSRWDRAHGTKVFQMPAQIAEEVLRS